MRKAAAPTLAKLTRPRLHEVLLRERLFAQLDQTRERKRAICVVGPPGAGKTTPLATWLDDREHPGLWLQVDAGDADLATFFYYLGVAAAEFSAKGRRPLPLLTPEYLGDVAGFSRRFFRELFARLPAGATMVLDNYQEVPAEHAFHALIAQAIEEVPPGSTLIAISRRDPPDAYARMIANDNVGFIDWADLKVTANEARLIGSKRSKATIADIDRMFAESGGWMAGLTLLLERMKRPAGTDEIDGDRPPQRVFDYFATEIFAQAPESNRDLLRRLAVVPRISARLAAELTGDATAARLLDHLYRQQLFIDRRGGESGTYTFHALFRAFLQHEAETALSADEIAALQRAGAQLLAEEGMVEDAMALYTEARDWSSAARLFAANAGLLLVAGRWQTVTEWFKAIPAEAAEAEPWVLHWAGAALVAVAPPQAREQLARAHRSAVEHGDVMCQIQCAAAIIESCCIEWSRFSLMDPWIPVLERALDDTLAWPSLDARLRAMNALLSALAYRAPEHPALPLCVERTLLLLPQATDANIKVVAASTLTNHGGHSGQPRIVKAGLAMLDRWIDDPAVTAPNRGAGLFSQVWGRHTRRNRVGSRESLAALESLAEESGLTYVSTFSAFFGTCVEGSYGDLAAARQWFHKLLERTDPNRWYDRAITCGTAIWLGVFERDPQYAMTYGEEGIALIADGVANSAIQWRLPVAVAHAYRGDREAVGRLISEIEGFMAKHGLHYWGALCRATEAILALQCGDEDAAVPAIAEMLRLQRSVEESMLWFLRGDLPLLLATALARQIDPDQVRHLVRTYAVRAPGPLTDPWPWPIRVRALGTLSVEVDDTPLVFKGKTPRKPLALLKAVICFGGRDVPVNELADAVWPDLDGDDALRAFHTALFRLRTLLVHDDVLSLSDGRLTLDRGRVWVDVLVFDDLCVRARAGHAEDAQRAIRLYNGPLFDRETEEPWMFDMRKRLDREWQALQSAVAHAADPVVIPFPGKTHSVNDR